MPKLLINIGSFLFFTAINYAIHVHSEKSYLAQIELLRTQLNVYELEKKDLIIQMSNHMSKMEQNTSSILDSSTIFYVVLGIAIVAISTYLIYSAFNSSCVDSQLILDSTTITANTSLIGDQILAGSLNNIDVNLTTINNVSLLQITNKLVEIDFKINDISYKIASLTADRSLNFVPIEALDLIREAPEVLFSLI